MDDCTEANIMKIPILATNSPSNTFFQNYNIKSSCFEEDKLERVLSIEDHDGLFSDIVDDVNRSTIRNFNKNIVTPGCKRIALREIQVSEFSKDENQNLHKDVSTWTTELRHLPKISHEQIHKYFVSDKDEDRLEKGATKHKIAGY